MTSRIMHPLEIEKATARIDCGKKSGTAFFVSISDKQQFLLTSNHNIPKDEDIMMSIGDFKVEGRIVKRFPDRDIALLSVTLDDVSSVSYMPLKSIHIPYNEVWETYGFPSQRVDSGGRYNGTVSRLNEGTKWDVDLECQQYPNIDDFSGLSGSVLFIDGFGVGVIGYDNEGTLGATSIMRVAESLIAEGIEIQIDKRHSIPSSIEADASGNAINDAVQDRINQVLSDHTGSGYYLIKGSPGSGKTTTVAQLALANTDYVIIDRYFIKVPASEEYSTQIRSSPEFFLNWITDISFRALHNTPPPKSKTETPISERINFVHRTIRLLSDHYSRQGKFGFLIVDGLDDVSKSKIEDFLSCLPHQLPPNIRIILACTSAEVLPSSIRSLIKATNEVIMTPLAQQDVERFISKELKSKGLSTSQIRELARKTEGHPLYMRYLIKYVLDELIHETVDRWIESIPVIGGNIEKYYNQLWSKIENQSEEVTLAATLARLRVPIKKEKLPDLLPESSGWNFLLSFKKVQHLLKGTELISIYHTSFSDFVNEKTIDIETQIHDNISTFTLKAHADVFGISERIYHLANGGDQSRKKAIEECNQNWVDDCALSSINPDIVLADIKSAIGLAADAGIGSRVISLLLLSQRVNFRYNSLFYDNATFLVCALLALNKPQEAIRYVVRNKALITSDDDALYLLQKFYECGATEEASTLLDVIKNTCNNILEGDLDSQSFTRFIHLKFSSVTLSSNADFEEAYEEFEFLKDKAIKIIKQNGNPDEVVNKFKDEVGSYNIGYLIFSLGFPPIFKELEGKFNFDDRSSGFIALSIYQSLEFEEKSSLKKQEDRIQPWVDDLETVIDKYNTHRDYHFFLLNALLGRSKRIDLIKKLVEDEFPGVSDFILREENGVDLNVLSMQKFGLFSECTGFLNNNGLFPELPKYSLSIGDWETNLKKILHYLFFLAGKVKRYRTENDLRGVDSLGSMFRHLLDKVVPDLRDRIYWKRSYALPESLYPFIYKRLIQLGIDAFPNQLEGFISIVENSKNYQLGLYTEGYTESLFTISRELAKSPNQESLAYRTTKVLERHIVACVENRWERNEYLLRLVELYAILDNDEKAKSVFSEMIDTSMGPSWYKESQLGIINTTVSNIIPFHGDYSHLTNFAAHLHQASGEMTFQRYVKQQQEDFVGDLAKVGLVNKAISFLKYLLLPDYKTILENATSGNVDKPYVGDGYVLGARAIEEQNGILRLLEGVNKNDSLIVWALTELFILGDDRYVSGYTELQANILNHFEQIQSEHLEDLYKRVSRFVVTEVDPEYREKYLQGLLGGLSPSNQRKMESHSLIFPKNSPNEIAENHRSPEQRVDSIQEKEGPFHGLVGARERALAKLNVENKKGAREIIVAALSTTQSQRFGIWSFNYATEIENIRDLLADTYANPSELIRDLKDLILDEPYFEEWVIASQIINLLRNMGGEQEKQAILNSVHEHLELMIRTPESAYTKYDWIRNGETERPREHDEQLLQLLIWFLNHPALAVKNRTLEILTWLAQLMPKPVIHALMEEIFSEGYKISKELSASVLHQISSFKIAAVSAELFDAFKKFEGKIVGQRHFMIRDSILRSLEQICAPDRDDIPEMIQRLSQHFQATNTKGGDIVLDDPFLEPIEELLSELNELKILNKTFAGTLLEEIHRLAPLSIKDSQLVSGYIDRSFNDHQEIHVVSDFDTLLRYALNISVTACTPIGNRDAVANILRFYQPLFPESNLATFESGHQDVKAAVIKIFEDSSTGVDLVENRKIPLSYFTTRHVEPYNRTEEQVELLSYLVPINQIELDRYALDHNSFRANQYPNHENYKTEDNVIPILVNSKSNAGIPGSHLVPPVLNPEVEKLLPNVKDQMPVVYWRQGRNWNTKSQGVPLMTGYFAQIDSDKLEPLKNDYRLILEVYRGHDMKLIDFFNNKEMDL